MNMRFSGLAVAMAHLGFLFLASAPQARAVFELTLSGGGQTVTLNSDGTCTANFAGGICPGTATIDVGSGTATYVGAIGGAFDLNVTIGTTKPGLDLPNLMDLLSIYINAAGRGDFEITWSDTDWSLPGAFEMTANGMMLAAAGSTVAYDAFYDSANYLYGDNPSGTTGTQIGSLGPFGTATFSGSVIGAASPGGIFSLTQKLTYTFTGAGVTAGDYKLKATSVPESASVAFVGAAVLLACEAIRRRFLNCIRR